MQLIWLAFFLSGTAGLSYELAWVRYLQALFGSSLPAVSTTVAVFFAGLGLGSWLLGGRFGRSRSPARAYAGLELAIAVAAMLVPSLFAGAEWLLDRVALTEGVLLRVTVAALVLLPATVLLGATFPAMAAVVNRLARSSDGSSSRGVGIFYGVNTLGAVAGCLLASFALMPHFGPALTTRCMAAVNVAAAALLLLSARRGTISANPTTEASPKGSARNDAQTAVTPLSTPRAWSIAVGTGLLGIAVEVLWTRVVALSFLPAVQVFALVLAAYLIGIGLGSLLIAALQRRQRASREWLFFVLLAAGIGQCITLLLLPQLSPALVALLERGVIQSWYGYLMAISLGSVLALLPSTLPMGASLPLLVGLSQGGGAARPAGRLYGVNVVAGIAGSLGAAFLLLPALGLSSALLLIASCYLVLALLVGSGGRPARAAIGLLCLGTIVIALSGRAPEANPYRGLLGGRVLFYCDEPAGSVEVSDDDRGVRHLRVNNFHGLSNSDPQTVSMQYALGHLPLLLHPRPERALLVGLGTGATLSAMAEHPLHALHAVEILGSLRQHASFFEGVNRGVLRDQRLQVVIDDGRRYLARRGQLYDVIVGDLFLPQHPGVGSLYSREHFRAARDRLAPSGLLLAWLPLFQLGPAQTASIARSFLEAFPDAEAWVASWSTGSPVLGLLGRRPPFTAAPSTSLAERFVEAQLRSLRRAFPVLPLSVSEPARLAPRRLLKPGELWRLAADAPINSLQRPIVEFESPRIIFEERVHGPSLARQNLRRLDELGILRGTPWEAPRASGGQ